MLNALFLVLIIGIITKRAIKMILRRSIKPGELDTTFDTNGIVITELQDANITETAEAVAVQPDGKILVAGTWGTNSFALARYLSNGTLDSGFGTNGVVITPSGFIPDLVLQPDGKILLAGTEGNLDFKVVRYETNGTLDNEFDTNGIALAPMPRSAPVTGITRWPASIVTAVPTPLSTRTV